MCDGEEARNRRSIALTRGELIDEGHPDRTATSPLPIEIGEHIRRADFLDAECYAGDSATAGCPTCGEPVAITDLNLNENVS